LDETELSEAEDHVQSPLRTRSRWTLCCVLFWRVAAIIATGSEPVSLPGISFKPGVLGVLWAGKLE
jgi:hypothetical protein